MTPAEQRLLEAVLALHQLHGVPPTIRMAARMLGRAKSRIFQIAVRLRAKGYIVDGKPRAHRSCLVPTDQARAWLDERTVVVPLIRS